MDIGSIFGTSPAVPQTPAVDMPAAAQPTLVNPPAASSLLTPSAMPGAVPVTPQVTHRRFGDSIGTRKAIYDSVLNAARAFAPATNNQYTLGLQNVDYDGRDNFTKAEQKKAILSGSTLGRSLRGDWVLTDPTGAEVSRKRALLARVPHMTERGTFIVNGSEYSLAHQMRLRPGIYTRQQENGEIEAHVNVKSGRAHKLFLDPATGIFRIKIGQARIPLVPLLKTMGVTDKQLRESWGDLAAVNQQKSDPQALKKLYERVRSTGTDTDPEAQAKSVAEAFQQMELDPDVTKRTLGQAFTRVGPDSILATTRKLLAVSRGEQEPDDRDSMAYQSLMGPEDLFAERITKAKNIARNLLWKSTARRGIDHIPAGVLTNALQSTLTMSGLGQALEEINTAEILDHQSRVTRRGEGGIQDASAIPMECHSADTEVFTSEGWVPWPEVSITTKFACKVNDRLEFHAASRLFCGEYVGRMYGLQTRTISYLVTPNHRMWCRKYRGGSSVRRCGFAPWGFASAAEVHRRAREFEITHLPAAGRNPLIFTVPCVDGARVQYAFDFNDWAELVGWYVAEGSINRHMLRVESKYQITLLQGPESHPDRVERISALLTRMGISFSFHERRFIFTSKQLGRWFEQCGIGELNKRLPEECFTWSAESRRRLLEAACLGNGSQKTNGVRTYCSNSLQLMRGISRLMLSLGTATREHTSTRRGSKEHRGRTITIRNDAHTCRELLSQYQGATSTPAYDNYFIQEYAGNVYCAEVPGGLLLTRRNKHVGLWLGNSRSVNPSQLGLIDYLRTPESLSAGIDVRLARNAMKGSDGRLYTKVINAKSGLTEVKSANDIADGTLAFSGELQSGKLYVNVLQNGKIRTVPREAVDYELPDTESSFSPLGNLIPFKSSVKGQRSVMGSRFLTQALPLENAEAPLVQSGIPGQVDRSFEQEYGTHMGALRSPQGGVVTKVTPEAVEVRYEDGTKETHELYVNHPMNRKTLIHQTPTVRPGQTFKQGDLLARSNYTDHEGTTALGMNARVAYLPDEGYNYEDAISISESFSKRMRSQHAYQHQHEWEPGDHQGKKAFISMFPSQYTKKQLDKFDDSGVVKQGETLHFGDPMILIASERERNKKSLVRSRTSFSDKSITWEHHSPGIVTDVVQTAKGPAVVVKSYASMQAADKLAGRVGDKGIISRIIPDDQMPVGEDGKPMEVLLNPLGLTSRTNPMQMIEAALGKIAAKTGKPFRMPDFQNSQDLVEMALAKLKEHNMSDTETVTLADGRKVKGVPVGNRWFMKLHHMADDKIQGRGLGAYDAEGAPQKGGQEGGKSKRVGMLEQNALLSHGALAVMNEDMRIKGQSSPEYWARYMSGYKPETPKVPFVYNKFVNQLRASGINVVRQGERSHIMAMTNKSVDELVGDRELQNAETVNWKNMEPMKGGLFDPTLTGGHGGTSGGGNKWAFIRLHQPLPNPVMEEPIRHILGLTQKKLQDVIGGKETLNGKTGAAAIGAALEAINLPRALENARADIKSGKKTLRDKAVRKLGYLKTCARLGTHPKDWMLDKVPVLPPAFRPVSVMGAKKLPLVADPNYLYKDLFQLNQMHKELADQLDPDALGDEQAAVYNAFKAVTGLGDPVGIKNQERGVKGILKSVFGSSPKYGVMNRKLLSSTVDMVGRGVIAPDPNLTLDETGIPETAAWDVFGPAVVRRMVRAGVSRQKAVQSVKDQLPAAKQYLQKEMDEGVVVLSRAPTLHRYGTMAFRPKLIKGSAIKMNPLVNKGFGADYDGDQMNFRALTTDEAKQEALQKMLPSVNLFSTANFKADMNVPSQEYVAGLYQASKNSDTETPPAVFATAADAIRAFRSGKLGFDRRIQILES